jgi:hypothetical protein
MRGGLVLVAAALLSLAASAAVAEVRLVYPDDCPARAQDCADTICASPDGGTLRLAAGHHETLGDVAIPDPFTGAPLLFRNFLIVTCSHFTLEGAGRDDTVLHANYACPANAGGGPPFIAFGGMVPLELDDVVIKDATFVCDPVPATSCAAGATSVCGFAPLSIFWSRGRAA